MSRHDSRAVEAAACLIAVLLALMLLTSVTGCATEPVRWEHYTSTWPWAEPVDVCPDICTI